MSTQKRTDTPEIKAPPKPRWGVLILGSLILIFLVIALVLVASGGLDGYACNNFC